MLFAVQTIAAALLISFCAWLSQKRPELAGFLIALPVTSMIALIFSYAEFQDHARTVAFAKGIFVGVPASMLFFVPFLLADQLQLSLPVCFVGGIMLLILGYICHQWLVTLL